MTHDIDRELAAVGSNADVQVVALADRARGYSAADGDWTGTLAFNVRKGMKATPENAVADWGERDMGSPQTLVDFVTWARASYPSRRTALIFWDHGWGWWPGNTMQDVTSNDYLDMEELRGALEAVGGVDMAGMETCLGQTIEVQAQFRGVAEALAGSEDSTGYTTFFYPEILGALQARPTMSASDLAVVAAKSIRTGHDKWSLTGSAVALDWRWDRLVQAVSDLGWDLGSGIGKYRAALGAARRGTASPPQSYSEVRDLYDMAAEIKAQVTSRVVRKECDRRDEVVAALHLVRVEPRRGGGDARHRHLLAGRTATQRGLQPMDELRVLRLRAQLHPSHLLGRFPRGLGRMTESPAARRGADRRAMVSPRALAVCFAGE